MSKEHEMEKRGSNRRGPMFGGPGGHGPGSAMASGKAKDFKGSFKRIFGYLSSFKAILVFVFTAAILSTIFNILGPKILARAMNILFEGFVGMIKGIPGAVVDFNEIGKILAFLGILYLISSGFTYIQHYLMAGVTQKTVYKLRKEVDEKLMKLPLKYFDSNQKGEILSRMTNDIDNISSTLQQSAVQIITSIVTVIGVLIMMLTISPLLTFLTLLTLPFIMIVTLLIAKRSQKYFTEQWDTTGDLNGHIEEMFTGHQLVKAFGYENKSIHSFLDENERLYEASWKAQFISGVIMPLMNAINNLGYVFVCIIGGMKVVSGTMTFGDITAFVQYQKQFSQPIAQTSNMFNVLQSAIASAERVFELLDEEEEKELRKEEELVKPEDIKGNILFEHVKFGYSEDNILIQDMNIEVKSGQMVAIVGPTGAGKTTLVNLLMRFYEILDGKITIDGISVQDMRREDLRSIFGMVLQDTWLFSGTIYDNILYGNEKATKEEIIKAAKAAHVHHFIKTLSSGYDTVLNEEGTNVSQGQKQLLTIARAMLADPSVLILDEATSSVDTRTEVLIQKAMKNLLKGRTSFVIAHRLSTIRDADLILVMKDGDIIEQGTHESLMAFDGFYTDLYNSQFAGQEQSA